MLALPRLRELQRSFATALMGGGDAVTAYIDGAGLDPSARLRIYRHSAAGTQIAALRDSYPTVRPLVGDEFFEILAAAIASDIRRPAVTCSNSVARWLSLLPICRKSRTCTISPTSPDWTGCVK